ncbi:hypothetical protein J0656_17265 [Muricauda ruestringensis]|uniref:Uncharacterized protein n=1 Tax=Flagellimonas aurea TaxID=2915619 RepID=A0ABS3G8M1_9FLAO|nr:hypothetical protein [Allomuricauda aurea]MBC72118.1 hypothetical protein [Allomuricauda sp.]MBO0355771.1 hypothetical protein [Allomuricauda aurea]|tara:strand:- start:5032 stop:6219 length:1188 start_codon:yes stop_codon:yes gene_type:complete
MLAQIKNINLLDAKEFAVIGVVLGNPVRFHIGFVRKESGELRLSRTFECSNFLEVQNAIPKKIPVILNFSNKGVINRMVKAQGEYLKQVLFNARPEDFYSYVLHGNEHNFVSICRKEVVDQHIGQLRGAGYHLVDYSIGPFVVGECSGIIEEDKIRTQHGELSFSNGSLVKFEMLSNDAGEGTYTLGNDKVKGGELVWLAAVLNYLHPSERIEYEKGMLWGDKREYKRKKIFELLAVSGLVAFMSALLGSYLLLLYFNKEYVRCEEQLYHFTDNYAQIKKMEEDLANKRFIAENSGVSNKNFLSFYLNELIGTTPSGVLLNHVEVNPLDKKVKSNEPVSLQSNMILVSGETNNSYYVNQWVKQLMTFPWVAKIEIMRLNRIDGDKETFSLKLEID